MTLIVGIINVLLVLLTVFAGPYRVVAFKFRTFGGIGLGLVTWLGVAIAFPDVRRHVPARGFIVAGGLGGAHHIRLHPDVRQVVQQRAAPGRRLPALLDRQVGAALRHRPLLHGKRGLRPRRHDVLPDGLCMQHGRISAPALRRRCEVWTPRDTQRLLAPVRIAIARVTAWVTWASPICGRLIVRYGLLLASATAAALQCVWLFLLRRAQQPAPALAQGQYVRPPTFGSRVMSFVVGHMLFSLITGAIGFWGIVKGIGLILAIPAAILLWAVGGKPDLPHFAKDDAAG